MDTLTADVTAELETLKTKSDKIRALDQKGMTRADIARTLGVRYQYVRNVLEQDRLKGRADIASDVADDGPVAPAWVEPVALVVGDDGCLRIPDALRRAMALDKGGNVTATVENGELRLIAPRVAIQRAQRELAPLKKSGESVVDGFLAERHAMWGEE